MYDDDWGSEWSNREYVLSQLRKDSWALSNADKSLKKDKDVVLTAVKFHGEALKYADESLKRDRKIVLAAIKQNGLALKYANEELKKDRDIVLVAVKKDGKALECADNSLKKDREIILEAVKQNGYALLFVDESLKKSREFILEAVKQNGYTLQHVNELFQRDREIVLEAVKRNGRAFQYANESLKKDRDFVLEAVKLDGTALEYAHESLKRDLRFIYALFKHDSRYARQFSPSITKQIENSNINLFDKIYNSKILELYSNSFIEENDVYNCIEMGKMFEPKSKSSIINFNPTYSAIFVEKLIIFQILKQLNYEESSEDDIYDLESANYYLFCFRLAQFLEDSAVQITRMRDLAIYVEKVASSFNTHFYSKQEIKEIMIFANKWLKDGQIFDNYKLLLSKYNELGGDLSKVFKALKYSYNYFKNDYDFISILGNGGEGVVFKVFRKDVKSIRALKLKYDPEQSIESGNQTLNLLKRNDIEGKIKCFDCGIIQNHLYSVMEIGEDSLSNYITRNNENGIYGDEFIRKDKLEEIVEIFIKVLNSVQSIHDHGILHRDLDPNNIVKVKDAYKIIDFETSRVVKKGNTITIGLGKYSYMSPEISHESYSDDDFKDGDNEKLSHNINITTSCDLFSLGCIFMKLLTNCPLQLDQQFVNDSDISKYGDNYLYFTGYGKYFYTVVTTTEGEMKLHYAIDKLINKSIDPAFGVNNLLIRSIITMIQRDSTKRLDCYSHKVILENVLKYLRGEIQDLTLNIGQVIGGMKEITSLRSYSQLINENTKLSEQVNNLSKLVENFNTITIENTQLVEKVENLSLENINLLERIKILELELSKFKQ